MRGTTNLEAWRAYLDGEKLFSINSKQKMGQSRRKFAAALKLDPDFARAHGYLSYVITRSVQLGWLDECDLTTAEKHARLAVKLDPYDYAVFWDLGYCLLGQGKLKPALRQYEKALDLYDNFTDLLDRKHGLLAEVAEAYIFDGRPDDAIKMLKRAKRTPDWYSWNLGWAYYNARDYDSAIKELECISSKPGDEEHVFDIQLMIAACYAQKGNTTMARNNLGLFRKGKGPSFTLKGAGKRTTFKNKRDQDHWIEGLRKAGVAEG
jgi:tetratricopeptide (TPR) repeat protein